MSLYWQRCGLFSVVIHVGVIDAARAEVVETAARRRRYEAGRMLLPLLQLMST